MGGRPSLDRIFARAYAARRRIAIALLLLGTAVPLSGCIVAPARPGFCYWHPGRC